MKNPLQSAAGLSNRLNHQPGVEAEDQGKVAIRSRSIEPAEPEHAPKAKSAAIGCNPQPVYRTG